MPVRSSPTFPSRFNKAAWLAEGHNSPDIFPQPRTPVYHSSVLINTNERYLGPGAKTDSMIWWHSNVFFPSFKFTAIWIIRSAPPPMTEDGSQHAQHLNAEGNLAPCFWYEKSYGCLPAYEIAACICCWNTMQSRAGKESGHETKAPSRSTQAVILGYEVAHGLEIACV